METVHLKVEGMTCMGCVRSVTNVLTPINGVQDVNVTLETGDVAIRYEADKAAVDQFKSAIEDAGYDVVS